MSEAIAAKSIPKEHAAPAQDSPSECGRLRSMTETCNDQAGYVRTDLGILPTDWRTCALRDVAERISVGLATSVTEHYRSSGTPIVRNLNIKDGHFDGSEMLYVSDQFAHANSSKAAHAFDVLTVRTGSNLGLTCVLPPELDSCQTFTTLITTPKKAVLDSQFLCLQMASHAGRAELDRLQVGGGKGNLNTGHLKHYRVVVPPLEEQRGIADTIRDVDALLGALDRLIAKKRDLKQAAMQQLLTGQTRLAGYRQPWTLKTLDDLFNFTGGYPASRADLSEDGLCYLHYGDIHGSGKTFIDVAAEQLDIPRLNVPLRKVPPGALLRDGDLVFVDASEDDEGASKHIVVINPTDVPFVAGLHTIVGKSKTNELAYEYRRYCFQARAVRAQFLFYAVGTKVTGISKTNIRKLTLLIPTIQEQRAVAEHLAGMDAEIAAIERRRDKARALKQGMMQQLLTGRIRLV